MGYTDFFRKIFILRDWFMIMKSEKSHGLLCTGCRSWEGSSGAPDQTQRPENGWGWWCGLQSLSEDLRTKSTYVGGKKEVDVPAQADSRQRISPSSAFLLHSGPLSLTLSWLDNILTHKCVYFIHLLAYVHMCTHRYGIYTYTVLINSLISLGTCPQTS